MGYRFSPLETSSFMCSLKIKQATLALLLVFCWTTGYAGIAEIRIRSSPDLETVRPLKDPVKISLTAFDLNGNKAEGTSFNIRLEAPTPGTYFSTDFPLVEGTDLIKMQLPATRGEVSWGYIFPIRGTYRLEVNASNEQGGRFKKVFSIKINENRNKLFFLISLLVCLFVLGILAGRWFSTPGNKDILVIAFFLSFGFVTEARAFSESPDLNEPHAEMNATLKVTSPRVGQLSQIRWRLYAPDGNKAVSAKLTLAVTQIEKDRKLFYLKDIPTKGEFSLSLQFTDASQHRVNAIAQFGDQRSVMAEKIVSVKSPDPPREKLIGVVLFFVLVTGLGLIVGRISRRRIRPHA